MFFKTHWCLTPLLLDTLYLLRQVLSLGLELTDWLNWLVGELWVSSCLQLLGSGITDTHYHIGV